MPHLPLLTSKNNIKDNPYLPSVQTKLKFCIISTANGAREISLHGNRIDTEILEYDTINYRKVEKIGEWGSFIPEVHTRPPVFVAFRTKLQCTVNTSPPPMGQRSLRILP